MEKNSFAYDAVERNKDRLETFQGWFPYPALLAFGLVLMLSCHLLNIVNHRVGQPANLINLPARAENEGSLYMSLRIYHDQLYVRMGDQSVFMFPQRITSVDDLSELRQYLQQWSERTIVKAAIANAIEESMLHVVIAADQRLKYLHVRPIINLLAEVGITNYSFETSMTDLATAENQQPDPG